MKSTLNINPQTPVEHTFPALYKSTTSDLVVLAEGIETGVVVVVGDNYERKYKLGSHSKRWIDFDDKSEWQRLPSGASVTLTQE